MLSIVFELISFHLFSYLISTLPEYSFWYLYPRSPALESNFQFRQWWQLTIQYKWSNRSGTGHHKTVLRFQNCLVAGATIGSQSGVGGKMFRLFALLSFHFLMWHQCSHKPSFSNHTVHCKNIQHILIISRVYAIRLTTLQFLMQALCIWILFNKQRLVMRTILRIH